MISAHSQEFFESDEEDECPAKHREAATAKFNINDTNLNNSFFGAAATAPNKHYSQFYRKQSADNHN
jgi:hypothetical protein